MLTATDRGMNGMMNSSLKRNPLQHMLNAIATPRPGTSVMDTKGLFVHTECEDCEKPLRVSAEGFEKTKKHWCENCNRVTPKLLQDSPLEKLIRHEERKN